jgi:hypothetical protein
LQEGEAVKTSEMELECESKSDLANSSEKVVFFCQSSERVVASNHLNIEMGLLHWYTIYDREETLNLEVIVV